MKKSTLLKTVFLAVIFYMVLFSFSFAYSENVTLTVECEENLVFSTYNIDVFIDREYSDTIPHGKSKFFSLELSNGNHTVSVTKEDDSSVVGHFEFVVKDKTELRIKCSCKNNKVVIKRLDSENKTTKNEGKSLSKDKSLNKKATESVQIDEGMLGDAYVKIIETKISKDLFDDRVLIVTYEWTNHGNRNASFSSAFDVKVYQDGVECSENIFVKGVDSSDKYSDVRPGKTQKLKQAYELKGTEDIEIEVTEDVGLFGTSKDGKVFKTVKGK